MGPVGALHGVRGYFCVKTRIFICMGGSFTPGLGFSFGRLASPLFVARKTGVW